MVLFFVFGGGLNFLRYTRCIQHSVRNMIHTFMVLLEVRDGVGRLEMGGLWLSLIHI